MVDSDDDSKNKDTLDVDSILLQIGEYGKYQKLLLWLICLPACFPCGFSAFNQLFMVATPDHWCLVPELKNFTPQQIFNYAIPQEKNQINCFKYDVNWGELLEENYNQIEEVFINSSWPIKHCTEGWFYNTTDSSTSIVIDFDLVCEYNIYPTLGLVALNIGGPLGVYIFGVLNDSAGRKISFFCCLTTLIVGNVLSVFSPNVWFWMVCRFIVGLTIPAMYQIPFILALELVGPNYRSFVTVLTCIFYTFGLIVLAGVTYLIRDWKLLTISTSLPFTLYYIYWFFLPESPRWLLAKGRYEEATKILEKLAKINNKSIPLKLRTRLNEYRYEKAATNSTGNSYGVTDLFSTPNMRLKTILITLNWFANEIVYVGLSYYGPSLGSNEYFSFMMSSVVEIPSYIVCWLLIDKWGRRWPLCVSMLISGVCCIATAFMPREAELTTLVLYLLSKFAISASFLIIYPFAGELYPTQLRGIGIGTSAYIAGIGLTIIPFINYLNSETCILPLVIMGIISIIGGLSGLRLPETLHYRLPQTMEEGEEFGKDFTVEDCFRCIPIKPSSSIADYEDLELDNLESNSHVDRRMSIRKLVTQSSIMEAPKDSDGTMKMAYWF